MRYPKILTTMQSYSWPIFVADLWAGITVAMVALPLSLAIAIASGAGPAQGLITAIIGGFLISLLGGSRVQIGGPTGAFIVVVYAVIQNHGYDGLILATFMAGAILLIAGWFRAGSLIRFVPEPVINGFTLGIAVIIASSQIKDFVGLEIDNLPADFLEKMAMLWAERAGVEWISFGLALLTLILIVFFRKIAPKFPGLIIAVAIGSALVLVFGLDVDTIASRFGELPNRLPAPKLPEVSFDRVLELLPSAITIAFLAAVESLLSAVVADKMIDGHHRPNAEVTAQGFANIASSLFGGLPVTGAIARTATNVKAGGKTPVAGIVHALTILLVLVFAAHLAGYLAMPALAALLMLTAWNMSEPNRWREHFKQNKRDIFLLMMTLILTIVVDLTIAIGAGIIVGLLFNLGNKDGGSDQIRARDR